MRKRVTKIFWLWELPKEEAWINEMASHGYGLVDVRRLSFDFEDIEPDKFRYKSMFVKGGFESNEVRSFLKFMEEMGIENVGHVSYPGHTCIYLRYDSSFGDADVFSDLDSRIAYEKVLRFYLLVTGIFGALMTALNLTFFAISVSEGMPAWLNLCAGLICLTICGAIAVDQIKRGKKIKTLTAEREIHE